MLSLIRKDFLIVKKLTFITMALIVLVPIFISFIAPEIPGIFTFLYMLIFGTLMLSQAISQEEARYPKAISLLCAAPYSRSACVASKYFVFIATFAYCYLVDTLVKLLINPSAVLGMTSVLFVLLIGVIIFGIYMPIEYQFGAVKARFMFSTVIILFSMGPSMISNFDPNFLSAFSVFNQYPSMMLNSILAAMSITLFAASLIISTKIFLSKEL
ncbi:ABC-2 transporter permease [Fusibacter paucivorans]|uniref:ABC-2 transporter permease n=1 Tax=Fusibacter paucivorans TaxID=76009 RepID=A0ABS5PKY0_9FIRM|nr:ABC-2 transporter permease [Fusibacter paucivorans]MBS7525708.1 ABC-2 transporter permease [Fusibacter paucivorans]